MRLDPCPCVGVGLLYLSVWQDGEFVLSDAVVSCIIILVLVALKVQRSSSVRKDRDVVDAGSDASYMGVLFP